MIRGPFDISINFAAGGNSERFIGAGWNRPEREYTFSRGHEARLTLPKPFDSDRYDLSIDVWPFVVPDRLPVQHIEVFVRGTQVMQAAVGSRERRVMGCEVPRKVVEGCASVDITFRFPDAAAPATVAGDSPDQRVLAFAFFNLKFSGRPADDQTTTREETVMP